MVKFIVTALSLIIVVCLAVWPVFAAEPLPVFVSIAPQKYFVQQIGKEMVDVQILVEPGADPHTYEPKPQQMVALSKARLFFAVGIEFEAAKLKKIKGLNAQMRVVHTDHGILKLPMAHHEHHGTAEDHDAAHTDRHHHDHEGLDPHIWLSPPLVMMQARTILIAFQEVDPANRTRYEANYREFIMELVDLDAQIRTAFDGLKGSAFMVLHPSWGTFAHTYGLKQIPIEVEGKSPKPAQLEELIAYAQANQVKVVFVQPQLTSKTAQLIAKSINGRVTAVNPLAEAWTANLQHVAEEFKHAFK